MNKTFCGLEKLSLVDFNNQLTCILFTNGCNFGCEYCHNAELLKDDSYLSWDDIKLYLESRKRMLDGVVISGGEPTLKPALFDICKEIKAMGYLVKLDTNGTNPSVVKRLIDEKLVDYIAMDIKNDINGYNLVTKVNTNMDKIKESINILMNSGIDYEFRTTLVKEYHTIDNIYNFKDLIKGAKVLYLQKFVLRDACINQQLHEVDIEQAKKYQEILSKDINKVELRGY